MGQGTIDGNKVFDPTGEEHKRGPHAFNMVNCRKFTLRDFSIVDHANYAIFFQECDNVEIRNVKISNGWDGVHFRGQPGHWCHNVNIIGCHFYTGDDCIAGDYWDRTVISDCIINSVCNGIRLIGPATHLIINNCLFYGPSTQPREQGRRNMLSGILLQPGAWSKTQGVVDDVFLADNTMHNVASPVTIWNNLGNTIGHITVSGLDASGIDKAAFSAESWTEAPITNLVLQNIHAEFNGGGEASQAQQAVKKPGFDVRSLPAWGLYARNVHELTIEDVRMSFATDDFRPVVVADGVEKLRIENFRYPSLPGVPISIFTTNVSQFIMNGTNVHQ
jgi:polygalacturonase